jgi:cysteine protease ATG4
MLFLNSLKRHFQTNSNLELLELIQENLTSAPFSLHRIVEAGKSFDKNPGEWYSPSLISHVIRSLTKTFRIPEMKVYVFMDSLINLGKISKESSSLVFVPLMLGISEIQPEYYEAIKFLLSIRFSVGIIGGIPKSALYLVGFQDDHLVFLDPHLVQPACTSGQDLLNRLSTYQCRSAKLLPFSQAESSISLGFYFRDFREIQEFQKCVQENEDVLHGILGFQDCEVLDGSSSMSEEDYVII